MRLGKSEPDRIGSNTYQGCFETAIFNRSCASDIARCTSKGRVRSDYTELLVEELHARPKKNEEEALSA